MADDAYTCGGILTEVDRYSIEEPNTFSCDPLKCDFTPGNISRNNGECTQVIDGAGACDGFAKNECMTHSECYWKPNHEEHCGYQRTIKH